MATLQQILLARDRKPAVIGDCLTLIDSELADKPGVSGAAVKLAYKTVSTFAPGYVQTTLENILPSLLGQLQPYWDDFSASGGADFGGYLASRSEEVANSLLSITDSMADSSDKAVVVRAYKTVRGGAAKNIEAALPRVGELVRKHAG